MGGNSVGTTRRVTTPTITTVDPSTAKLDALMGELSKLSPSERGEAVTALKAVGLAGLASALKAVAGTGSAPPERPVADYTPPA